MILAVDAGAIEAGFQPGALLLGLLLLLLNGYFVAAEIALLAAQRIRIEELAETGDAAAGRALDALRELSVTFSGAQLGITMCSLGLGAIAEPALASLLAGWLDPLELPTGVSGAIAFAVALAIVVFLHMVIGEMVPKNLALADAERISVRLASTFRVFVAVFRPLIVALNSAANALVRLTGTEPISERDEVHTADDLRMALQESVDQGYLTQAETRILRAALSLGDIDASSAMTPRVDLETVAADDSVDVVLEVAAGTGHSRLPVRGEDLDDIVGMVHVKDLLIADEATLEGKTAADVMRDVPVVPDSRDLDVLLEDMRLARAHLVLVVDEHGGTAGVLSLEDVLEELVGEIEDEFDPDDAHGVAREGVWVVDGLMRRDEVERSTGLVLPEGEAETISGIIAEITGHIPEVGDEIDVDGWTITVVSVDGRRAGDVRITAVQR